ncbi:MAG: hypothetical protein ACKO9Q_20750, partial [Pirellula sp.]
MSISGYRRPIILRSLLAINAFAWSAHAQDTAQVDSIYYNGKVVTVDQQSQIAQAFGVSGETIVAVGDEPLVRSFAQKDTAFIDLQGKMVLPCHKYLANKDPFSWFEHLGSGSNVAQHILDRLHLRDSVIPF